MARCRGFFVGAFVALFVAPSRAETRADPAGGGENATVRGVPALFSWGDVDGDGRLDLAAVGDDGTLQLLIGAGDGRFEDVTERVGLAAVGNAALALWADYDGDGRLDLFVGAREGASRLFHNERGAFVDMSAGSGLASEGAVQSAQWLDLDGDGRLDLFVVTAEKNELCAKLFRGLEGGFFALAELPLACESSVSRLGGADVGASGVNAGAASGSPSVRGAASKAGGLRARDSIDRIVSVVGGSVSGGSIALGAGVSCLEAIKDEASPSLCLNASTTPTLGKLYPISANLFVAVGGNVGVGTTSPAAKLEVAGTARITDTLTLAPSGDQALDVSTGSIYEGGALFIHTKGTRNTAIGRNALANLTSGFNDAASGYRALYANTSGENNTASGVHALSSNTSGNDNTANGAYALRSNTTGSGNTANGLEALESNTTGFRNTASGARALFDNTTGGQNTATGYRAMVYNTTGTGNAADGSFALRSNTTGICNTASGHQALAYNSTGSFNSASGYRTLLSNVGTGNAASGAKALFTNTTGDHNTASGYRALYSNTTGSRNIALGRNAGNSLTTGSDNIAIGNAGVAGEGATIRVGTAGTHARAFVAGVRSVTTDVADAIPVVVDSNGQLGTVSSSRRFKKDIADMGDRSERLLELRPVVFRYKQEQTLPNGGAVPLEYGLIAEEVAEIFPDLVVYDEEGKPFTVKYHLLSSMLLNEMKEQAHELEDLRSRLAALESRSSSATSAPQIPASGR